MANETLNIQNGVSPITIDTEVTEGSMRPVTSDGIYKAIQAGGGGGGDSEVLSVLFTFNNGSVTATHTPAEVAAAISEGKCVQAFSRLGSETILRSMTPTADGGFATIFNGNETVFSTAYTGVTINNGAWDVDGSFPKYFAPGSSSHSLHQTGYVRIVTDDGGYTNCILEKGTIDAYDLSSGLATLLQGAMSYANPSITLKTTITDAQTVAAVVYVLSSIYIGFDACRPQSISFAVSPYNFRAIVTNTTYYMNGAAKDFYAASFSFDLYDSGYYYKFAMRLETAEENGDDVIIGIVDCTKSTPTAV